MSKGSKTDQNQPMDPGAKEVLNPVQSTNNRRVCYAAKTLVAEVMELFPETNVEYSNYNGRNTALDVTFDFSMVIEEDRALAIELLSLLGDPAHSTEAWTRLDQVIVGGEGMSDQVLVAFKSNAQTQDSREPFGLGDALLVLSGDES